MESNFMDANETTTLTDLLSLKSRHLDILSEAQRHVDAIETVVSLLRSPDQSEPAVSAPQQLASGETEPETGVPAPGWRSRCVVDLSDQRNLIDRLRVLAQAWDGVLDAMETAEYLVFHGYSDSTPKNLRPHVYNAMVECPDFVKIRVGTFRYVPDSDNLMTVVGCESGMTTI